MNWLRLLIPPKKVLTTAGIELESPRLPVSSADHSATRPKFFQKILFKVSLFTAWMTPMLTAI